MGCFIGCLWQKKRIKQGGVKVKASGVNQSEISMEDGGLADTDSDVASTRVAVKIAKNSPLVFNLEDLLRASAEVLGNGIFGTSYKAFLEIGTTVVVKRMKDFDLSKGVFAEMIDTIEKMNHENLLPLTASYYSKDEKLLVHEYMPIGSLYALLHGNRDRGVSRTPLNWDTRSGIALGAARAIAYLHSLGPLMSHGNIKSSNILLTSTFEARVSDYELAYFAGPAPLANRVAGYHAPEVGYANQVPQKADVYSYGVLFLELLTGKDPDKSYLKDEGMNLPSWIASAVNDEWTSEVFDVEILQSGNLEEVMLQLLELAFSCTAYDPDNRPSMAEVISRIEILRSSSSQVDEKHINVEENESS